MKKNQKNFILLLTFLSLIAFQNLSAQFETRWMAAGSLHNWYSAIGSEIEEGLVKQQQYGMRWPAIYRNQDMQAAKGFWIGADNFTDQLGVTYPHKVVHVGPRVSGSLEFFPMEFRLINKFENSTVTVDGVNSFLLPQESDVEPDPTMPYDRMIYNVTNTQLGLTMTRKIIQFSQEFHDNYIIHEFVFKNTGNIDDDIDIELPNNTLTNVYFFWQNRWAINKNTRYVIGNGTGWGMNTMNDRTGTPFDNYGKDYVSLFAWHGKFPSFTAYDNIGGPIWTPDAIYSSPTDTLGRLGASQFVGNAMLYADPSNVDPTIKQPSTTNYVDSDDPLTSQNDAYNAFKMTQEYELMTKGHANPMHAWKVEPAGNFVEPTGDPAMGTSGGFSTSFSYGPYNIAPGDSVKIVWIEASAGLSREKNIDIGRQFKNGVINAKTKNEFVMTSRDSLFQTFERAIANYNDGNGYLAPEPPMPPKSFSVTSGGDKITLEWDVYDASAGQISGFEIYRARGDYDSTYTLLYSANANERSFEDVSPIRGVNYYYYITSIGNASDNNGGGKTPSGALKSSRYFTQTYDPATLKRPAESNMDKIRIVPNPYIISADPNKLRFPGEEDKIAFLNIPGNCSIQIYTELGELIYEIDHTDGSGDAYWYSVTSSNQIVVSGIYIAVINDNATGDKKILKFAVIR